LSRFFAAIENHPRLSRWSDWMAGLPLVGRIWSSMLANRRAVKRFTKFAIVGAIGAVVDFVVLNIMKLIFESIGLGVGAAVLSNFTWNRLWTFPESRERPLGKQLVQFAIVSVLGLIINTVLLLITDRYVFQRFFDPRVSYNLAKAVAICVVLFWNFGINLIWTYRGIEVGAKVERPVGSEGPAGEENGARRTQRRR
jgi:putative flippase GtrA